LIILAIALHGKTTTYTNKEVREYFFQTLVFMPASTLLAESPFFDGERWRLCTPKPSLNDNLISGNYLKTT